MDDRKIIAKEISSIEAGVRELVTLYEQYFAGVEKREPQKKREELTKRIRRFTNRKIMQTDLRFQFQNLATRYHSYAGYWDRILRLMDEGKYVRQTHKPMLFKEPKAVPGHGDEVERLHRDLVKANTAAAGQQPVPDKAKIASFISQQRQKIKEKFGDREVEFRVVSEEGKTKIKVRPKG